MFVILNMNIWVLLFAQNVAAQGKWTRKADFPGEVRYREASFSIGTKCYIGKGFGSEGNSLDDFWEWDQSTNIWTKKADFPGNSGYDMVSFSIGTKGYVGTGGYMNVNDSTNEFWEYDPAKDTWNQKASIPKTAGIYDAVGFSIGTKGYIGTGLNIIKNSYTNEFWEWDQITNRWTQRADFAGPVRQNAIGLSIGNKGYIGTGMKLEDGELIPYVRYKDFWEWDQANNAWTQKADIGGSERSGAVGFSIGNKGYIGAGFISPLTYLMDFWEWDQATNTWKQEADYEGFGAYSAIGFSAGDKGYLGLRFGYADSEQGYNDFWEFDPSINVTTAINSISDQSLIEVYPNPVNYKFTIKSSVLTGNSTLSIFNSNGQKVMERLITEGTTEIDASMLQKGLYLIKLDNGKSIETGKIVKE